MDGAEETNGWCTGNKCFESRKSMATPCATQPRKPGGVNEIWHWGLSVSGSTRVPLASRAGATMVRTNLPRLPGGDPEPTCGTGVHPSMPRLLAVLKRLIVPSVFALVLRP